MSRAAWVTIVSAPTTVETGTPLSVTINTPYSRAGFLCVRTTAEVNAASLVVTVFATTPLGDLLLGTLAAVTTETTTWTLLGGGALTAGEGVTAVEPLTLGFQTKFVFTVTGATASFDVEAGIQLI